MTQQIKKLKTNIKAVHTNKVETLNVENYHIGTESLTQLLSSQTGIKTLRINMDVHGLPGLVKNVYSEKIVEAIIRNQETIQVIEICIETTFPSFPKVKMLEVSITKIQDIVACKRRFRFPSLKSLTLGPEAATAIEEILSKDLFNRLITNSPIEEFYCSNVDVTGHIENGNLGLLKRHNLLCFRKYGEDFVGYGIYEYTFSTSGLVLEIFENFSILNF